MKIGNIIIIGFFVLIGAALLLPGLADKVRGCTPEKEVQGQCNQWSSGGTSYRSSGGFGGTGTSFGGGK